MATRRAFAEAWPDAEFVQAVLAQLPWYHQLALLDKLHTPEERRWYAEKAIENNWSRNVLVSQIDTRLHQRSGSAVTNFKHTLPQPDSDLAVSVSSMKQIVQACVSKWEYPFPVFG